MLIILLGITLPNSVYAARGCCSHHGGVAYCDSSVGKYVCADGTYSPSCGCYKEVKTTTKKKTTISTTKKRTTTTSTTTTTTTSTTTTSTTTSTTVATSKKKTTSTKTTTKKIEVDINSEESTSSPVIGTLLLGAGGAYVYNEYKKTKLKK